MRELLRHLIGALENGHEILLCQVAETKGSTPQKAGALMLVGADGGQVGTLGGGCVENEVKQRALGQLGHAGASAHAFLLDHDYAWADGLICGGRMVIVAEALKGAGPLEYFRTYQRLLEAGCGFTEGVVLDAERALAELAVGNGTHTLLAVGARFLLDAAGQCVASWPAQAHASALAAQAAPLSDRPKPSTRAGVAWLPTLPRIRLVIVGAGHVGQAVANLAAQADFDVWVVDDRHQYANAERLPAAEKIIVGAFDEVLPQLEITPHTYALIVTRGHGHDQESLYHLANSPAAYVGLIGSKRKIRLIFEGLREAGISEEALSRVTAPVGLDIGSQTVPEIAISIVAELIAKRNLGIVRTQANPRAERLAEPSQT